MPENKFEATLLTHVQNPNYHPVKPRVIAKQLGIGEDDLRDLKRAIKRLVKRGQLRYGASHQVLAP